MRPEFHAMVRVNLDYGVSTTHTMHEFNIKNNFNDPMSIESLIPGGGFAAKAGHYEIAPAEGPLAPSLAEHDQRFKNFSFSNTPMWVSTDTKHWIYGVEVVLVIMGRCHVCYLIFGFNLAI